MRGAGTRPAVSRLDGPPVPLLRLMTDGIGEPHAEAPGTSDAELVARAIGDDAQALELLARRHYRAAYAVALAVMGNSADAEDVCHDGLVRGLSRLKECRRPDRVAQWLCAIVRNHSRNELGRPSVVRGRELSERLASGSTEATREIELKELRVRLEEALGELTPVEREVVLLADLHDWSHEQIAQSIGTSPGMSRQHLFKARRRLREILGAGIIKEQFNE